jgi:hypothetical protein
VERDRTMLIPMPNSPCPKDGKTKKRARAELASARPRRTGTPGPEDQGFPCPQTGILSPPHDVQRACPTRRRHQGRTTGQGQRGSFRTGRPAP